MLKRRLILAAVSSGLLPSGALAHALVTESSPALGASLAAAPARATLRFNSRIDQARSKLTLIGPDGSNQVLAVATDTPPTVLDAPLPADLPAGAWRLRWQVLAADGHITRGDVSFTLGPR